MVCGVVARRPGRFLRRAGGSAERGDEHLAPGGCEVRPQPDRARRGQRGDLGRSQGAGPAVRGAQPVFAGHVQPAALPSGDALHRAPSEPDPLGRCEGRGGDRADHGHRAQRHRPRRRGGQTEAVVLGTARAVAARAEATDYLLYPEPLGVGELALPCLLMQSWRSVPDNPAHWAEAPPDELLSLVLPGVEVSLLDGLPPEELLSEAPLLLEPPLLLAPALPPELEPPALELSPPLDDPLAPA